MCGATTPDLVATLCHAPPTPLMNAAEYRTRFAALPEAIRASVTAAWGAPPDSDPVAHHLHLGHLIVAVQPPRDGDGDKRAAYHDPTRPPDHRCIAYHLWLQDAHALIQLGTHGYTEWLPGKARRCRPRACRWH